MPAWKEWENHFDKISPATLKRRMGAIGTLLKDPMIEKHYGSDLRSLRSIMKGSILYRNK
jgi:hypothetical protein